LLAAVQGGLLLAQTTRSTEPLERALDHAIGRIQARVHADDAACRPQGEKPRNDNDVAASRTPVSRAKPHVRANTKAQNEQGDEQ
jgi:hypothetical protein